MARRNRQLEDVKAMYERQSHSVVLLSSLKHEWENEKPREGSHKHDIFPIKLVALLEGFTREQVAMLVEQGQPFVDRCAEFLKDLKFDLRELWNLKTEGKLSVGTFASFYVNVSNLAQLEAPFKAIIPDEYKRLGKVSGIADSKKSLSDLFKVRHILCHEIVDRRPYKPDELDAFFEAVIFFTRHIEDSVMNAIHPNGFAYRPPRETIIPELNKVREEVQRTIEVIETHPFTDEKRRKLIEDVKAASSPFVRAWCELRADLARGGSMASDLSAMEALAITREELARWQYFERAGLPHSKLRTGAYSLLPKLRST